MRLIDADAIIKQFDPNTWQGEMMIKIVNGLPTAYDVEKVVTQIKEYAAYLDDDNDVDVVVEDLISIVKGAVKDE